MSFILDALKKSESERQQQAGAEFSDVPSGSGEAPSFKWLWLLAIILLVNLVVLLGILFRPDSSSDKPSLPSEPVESVEQAPAQQARAEPTFEDRVAEVKRAQPATQAAASTPVAEDPLEESGPATAVQNQPEATSSYLKTIDELRLEGALQLNELHLDIHVYADEPAERFVFINMNKHTENSRLAEGPVVKEITTDGVILEHQGLTFLLPRE